MNTVELLSSTIGISQQEVQGLLALSKEQVYKAGSYQDLVSQLDYNALSDTLPAIRQAYELYLPVVVNSLRTEHGYTGNPMTPSTLGNWVLGFLYNPAYLDKLPGLHRNVPIEVIEAGLPQVLDVLDHAGEVGQEWKKALAVLSLPFFAAD